MYYESKNLEMGPNSNSECFLKVNTWNLERTLSSVSWVLYESKDLDMVASGQFTFSPCKSVVMSYWYIEFEAPYIRQIRYFQPKIKFSDVICWFLNFYKFFSGQFSICFSLAQIQLKLGLFDYGPNLSDLKFAQLFIS